MKENIAELLKEYDFLKRLKKEPHAQTRMRLLGMQHLKEGKSTQEVGHLLKMSRISVRKWFNRYKQEGVQGLKNRPGRGRKRWIQEEKKEEIRQAIEEMQKTREGGRIRGRDVQEMLKERFGINFSMGSIYHVLKQLGMSWITSRSVHSQACLEEQEAFKKTLRII